MIQPETDSQPAPGCNLLGEREVRLLEAFLACWERHLALEAFTTRYPRYSQEPDWRQKDQWTQFFEEKWPP